MTTGYDLIAQAASTAGGSGGGITRAVGRRLRQALLTTQVRDALVDASQNAVRNDIEARAAIRRMQQYTVGAEGPTLAADTGSDALDRLVDELWAEWCEGTGDFRCDVYGLRSFAMILRGVVEAWMADGRAMLLKVSSADADGALQEIETRRVVNPNGRLDGETLIAGIELAGPGRRVKCFHVARVYAGGMAISSGTDEVEAEDAVYAMQPLDAPPGVLAPEPILGVGIRTINQIVESLAATNEAMRVQAMAPIAISRAMETGDLGPGDQTDPEAAGFTADETGRAVFQFVRNLMGNIIDLAPGDTVENLRQEISGEAIRPLIEVQLRRIGMLLGIGPHILSGDFAETSWSVAKLEIQATQAVRDTIYAELIRSVVRPARRHTLEAALRMEMLTVPPRDEMDLSRFTHRPPPLPDPDPDKTQQTRALMLSRGMLTMGDYLAERGESFAAHTGELAAEIAEYERLGLTHPAMRDDSGEDAQLDETGGGTPPPPAGTDEPRPAGARSAEGRGGGRRNENRSGSFR